MVKPFSRNDIVPAMQVAVSRYAEMTCSRSRWATSRSGSRRARRSTGPRASSWPSGLSEPEAFHRLQKLAMDKRKSLREVAEAIITAHEAME